MIKKPFSASERELAAQIDSWLAHMRWRPDFETWRMKRLYQEEYQEEAIALLRESLHLRKKDQAKDQAVDQFSGLRLLDVGCGMGGFAVAARLAGAEVVALDYNPAYAAITTLRAKRHNLTLPVGVAAGENLPLPSAHFDAVTCWDVLEHAQAPKKLLTELARVLRPDGVLVLTAINRFAFRDPHYHLPLVNWMPRFWAEMLVAQLKRQKQGAFQDRQKLSEMHYFTWNKLQEMINEFGFTLYDLDERRVARGEIGKKQRWRKLFTERKISLLSYKIYRTIWQGTWRLALVKEAK